MLTKNRKTLSRVLGYTETCNIEECTKKLWEKGTEMEAEGQREK